VDALVDMTVIAALRGLDSSIVSNAIETFDVRLRNEGFTNGSIRCLFHGLPPAIGYAVTARIRCATPPPVGHNYDDRTDWWNYILTVPAPRVVVIEDADERPGLGAMVGGVHANILRALGSVAVVTNGAVRDLPAVRELGLQVFAGSTTPSHAFAHIVDFGQPVKVAGLPVTSGELLFGDRHGVVSIPADLAASLPSVATKMRAAEQKVIDVCRSPDFSIEKLRSVVGHLD
jgi:4-hydroxy-4-methyl-2-oxoglutarate aldolase